MDVTYIITISIIVLYFILIIFNRIKYGRTYTHIITLSKKGNAGLNEMMDYMGAKNISELQGMMFSFVEVCVESEKNGAPPQILRNGREEEVILKGTKI
jgi:hypothetical protein